MRLLKQIASILGVMLLVSVHGRDARAGEKSYKSCQITNGQIFSCGPWYQGEAVVYRKDAYYPCSITNGQVVSCGAWYQGKAVAYRDGSYQQCQIANGQILFCSGWYQGQAVVFTDR